MVNYAVRSKSSKIDWLGSNFTLRVVVWWTPGEFSRGGVIMHALRAHCRIILDKHALHSLSGCLLQPQQNGQHQGWRWEHRPQHPEPAVVWTKFMWGGPESGVRAVRSRSIRYIVCLIKLCFKPSNWDPDLRVPETDEGSFPCEEFWPPLAHVGNALHSLGWLFTCLNEFATCELAHYPCSSPVAAVSGRSSTAWDS